MNSWINWRIEKSWNCHCANLRQNTLASNQKIKPWRSIFRHISGTVSTLTMCEHADTVHCQLQFPILNIINSFRASPSCFMPHHSKNYSSTVLSFYQTWFSMFDATCMTNHNLHNFRNSLELQSQFQTLTWQWRTLNRISYINLFPMKRPKKYYG